MFPEDRVLVGVVNRKRDLELARDAHWYRIPQKQLPNGVNAEYIAFFLSRAFKERNGGIYYYAEQQGLELAYRKDLLPKEANHKHANEIYYKVQISALMDKEPPVLNPTKRSIAFIYTTWDRFVKAQEIRDLYSTADYFVDRIYHALRQVGIRPQRFWEAEYRDVGYGAQLRILCQRGTVAASTYPDENSIYLDENGREDAILTAIRAEIEKHGGPVTIGIPLDGL